MTRTILALALLMTLAAPLCAQDLEARAAALAARVELGERMFKDQALSANGTVSCATCHDPEKQFADGKTTSIGVLGVEVGRNAPSLVATARISRFPAVGPTESVPRSGRGRIRRHSRTQIIAQSLEDRCLGPIENPAEMGASIDEIVDKLGKDRQLSATFNAAFGGTLGVTRGRLGRVLADYLRSLEPDFSPYHAWLTGEQEALDDSERAGLGVFEGVGRCTDCHSGSALSDGKVHFVAPMNGERARVRLRAQRQRTVDLRNRAGRSRDARISGLFRSNRPSGYDGVGRGQHILALTPPLWDLRRTAPYFRDGSVRDLRAAVKQHIEELRAVAVVSDKRRAQASVLPPELTPGWRVPPPPPARLKDHELTQLVAFLNALSPKVKKAGDD